mmetsp:Transcript_88289/g.274309  ORF Transcript_88289/g.274309 Transcript_88289/m.274309 type:complete len:260 (-) Transcript_88289:540-1319(-)
METCSQRVLQLPSGLGLQRWVLGNFRGSEEGPYGVCRVGEDPALPAGGDVVWGLGSAGVAVQRLVVHTAGLAVGVTPQAHVAPLAPGAAPAVPQQPIVHSAVVLRPHLAVAHEHHSVVEDGPRLAAAVEDALLVEVPPGGGHAHGHGPALQGLQQRPAVVLRQLRVAPDARGPRCVTPVGGAVVQALEALAAEATEVGVVPLGADAAPGCVVEGELRRGPHAAARAAAAGGVRRAGVELLGREVEERAGLQGNAALQHL